MKIRFDMHRFRLALAALVMLPFAGGAQQLLTLQQCRDYALAANLDIRIAEENQAMADDLKRMALSEFFPKATANGAYLWNEKNAQLLSSSQQDRLSHMGTNMVEETDLQSLVNIAQALALFNPTLGQALSQFLNGDNLSNYLNQEGQRVVNAMDMDLTNIYAGAVTLTQPIYMGGKIRAAYRTAKLYDEIAHLQCDKQKEDKLIAVDEAYWRVVSLEHKQQLAQKYCDLLRRLSSDVDAMVETGVATIADQTKVRVKLNEAEMTLTKASNGLVLSRMVLNQMCGLPLNNVYALEEDARLLQYQALDTIDMAEVLRNRNELQMLRLGEGIADCGVKMAASALLPNVAAMGGYAVTNPNFQNGYDKSFAGGLTAGVAVNIPLAHPDAIFATKAAKHKRTTVQLQLQQAEEMIELQANKLNYELAVANEKLIQAKSALKNAEDNLKNADESFAAGVISSGDLMQAQTAWMQAQTEVIDAEIEIRMDKIYLSQALGSGIKN